MTKIYYKIENNLVFISNDKSLKKCVEVIPRETIYKLYETIEEYIINNISKKSIIEEIM